MSGCPSALGLYIYKKEVHKYKQPYLHIVTLGTSKNHLLSFALSRVNIQSGFSYVRI